MKDPYLKPVILGGLFITLLSIVFALGIFLWAIVGGYITVRLTNKITKQAISVVDGLLIGLFSGIIGGCCLNIITTFSFKSFDNKRLLIRTLEQNWPKEMYPIPEFQEMLPSIFLTTCVIIMIITTGFALIGGLIGVLVSKRTNKLSNS